MYARLRKELLYNDKYTPMFYTANGDHLNVFDSFMIREEVFECIKTNTHINGQRDTDLLLLSDNGKVFCSSSKQFELSTNKNDWDNKDLTRDQVMNFFRYQDYIELLSTDDVYEIMHLCSCINGDLENVISAVIKLNERA